MACERYISFRLPRAEKLRAIAKVQPAARLLEDGVLRLSVLYCWSPNLLFPIQRALLWSLVFAQCMDSIWSQTRLVYRIYQYNFCLAAPPAPYQSWHFPSCKCQDFSYRPLQPMSNTTHISISIHIGVCVYIYIYIYMHKENKQTNEKNNK